MIAMYGGPFDVYSIPELGDDDELRRERYDLDRGDWVEGGEPLGYFYREQQLEEGSTPAAPGIDLEQFREAVTYWRDTALRDMRNQNGPLHERVVEAQRLLALIDASPKGALNEQFGSAEGLDSPKGGSEARVPSAWISDNDILKLRSSIDEARNIRMSSARTHLRVHPVFIPAMQASDAETKPCRQCGGDGRECLAGRSAHPSNWAKCAACEGSGKQASDAEVRPNEPPKNWCPACGKRPNDPTAVLCPDAFHHQANSHGAGVSNGN